LGAQRLQLEQQVVLTVDTLEKVDGVTLGTQAFTQKKGYLLSMILLKYMMKTLILKK
jgi:hypothetical protein